MAPEQWQGKPLPATDQYALGIILYQWLCGELPFGGGALQLMYQHLHAPPPPLRDKVLTISPEIEQVVLKSLAKDAKDRFASVSALARALEQAYQPKPPPGTSLLIYRGHSFSVTAVAWSPDGRRIASGSGLDVQVWDAATGAALLTYRGHSSPVHAVAWSPDGRRIASGSHDKTVQVWQAV